MNGSIAEAMSMSIDDSLTILNGALNAINEQQAHLVEEIENELDFSSKIEQPSVPAEGGNEQNDGRNNETIQRKSTDLVEIEFAKQIAAANSTEPQPTKAQTKPEQAKIILSIQSIVEQAVGKQSSSDESEQTDQTDRYDLEFWRSFY